MSRKKRVAKVKADRVGLGAAIPLVFVCAFGTALANEIGTVCIGFLVEVCEPIVEHVEDIAYDILD